MLDSFLIAGIIEARSHERLSILALNSKVSTIRDLYQSLVESEARHFGGQWKLAQSKFEKEETFKRLDQKYSLALFQCQEYIVSKGKTKVN